MTRRTDRAGEEAARAASEAARTLQARGQEAKAERVERVEAVEPVQDKPTQNPDRIEKLLNARPHVQALEEIVESRLPKEEEAKAPPVEAPKAAEPAAAVEVVAEAAPVEVVPEAPKTVKVKVDGEEFEVAAEEVESAGGVAAYQRDRAADKRLRSANEAVAESKRLTAQLVEMLQKRQTPDVPQQTDDEFIRSKVDVIRFGTPEESAAALREVMQRGAPKPVDQNAIIGQALQAVNRQQAAADFSKQFSDVIANPLLLKLAVTLEQEELGRAQKTGQPIDWGNLYSRIGTQVRSVAPRGLHQSTTTPQTPSTTSPVSEKEARKASIVTIPTAAARAELPKESKPETREDILNEMKKSRGIPLG